MEFDLIDVAQLVGCRPAKPKVIGSVPGQGICLGCGQGSWLRRIQDTTN